MVSKSKKNNALSDNILYLQDADAKALGIIEGSAQTVFVDGKEVDVVFVDEHEVLPVSNEDKKIYQDAYKIASKYLNEINTSSNTPAWNALSRSNAEARKVVSSNNDSFSENYYNDRTNRGFSLSNTWQNVKNFFSRRTARNNYYVNDNESFDYDSGLSSIPNSNQRSMIRYQNKQNSNMINPNYNAYQRHAQHSIKNDVFTNEELEIIQNVIDKSRASNLENNNRIHTKNVTNLNANSKSNIKNNAIKNNQKKSSNKK